MTALAEPDRCWVVAGLGKAGLTAEEIADRLGCSLRLVRTVRAEPLTAVCTVLLSEASAFNDELRLARSEQTRLATELAETIAECQRLRGQIDRLIPKPTGAKFPLCSAGKHPMSPTNSYRLGRRVFCRGCHADRQASYRARRLERKVVRLELVM